jgi:tRNA-dihydrouridine synthase 2
MGDYCRAKTIEYREKGFQGRFEVAPERLGLLASGGGKRKLKEEADDVLLMCCAFLRNNYRDESSLPKSRLAQWTKVNRKKLPSYLTIHEEKLFRSVVLVDGRKYGSSFWFDTHLPSYLFYL